MLFAFANQVDVVFRLVPFVDDTLGFSWTMPLYQLVFSSFLIGGSIGGAMVGLYWWRSAKRKRLAAKESEKTVAPPPGKPPVEPEKL